MSEDLKVVVAQPDSTPDGVEDLIPEPFESTSDRSHKNLKYKRTKLQRDEDLALIIRMHNERKTPHDIAAQISKLYKPYTISREQVYYDLKEIEKRVQGRIMRHLLVAKGEELDRSEFLEREAMEAWEASKQPEVIQRQEDYLNKEGEKTRTVRVTEKRTQHGDSSFLILQAKLSEARRKLLGLDSPIRTEVDVTGSVNHTGLDMKRAREVLKKKLAQEIIDIPQNPAQIEQKSSG